MIRKIQTADYLRRYDNMSAEERSAYKSRVGGWLRDNAPLLRAKTDSFESRLQNVVTLSASWNDRECAAFENGARLLSALVNGGETWLPDMLYTKAAGRCVKRMCGLLGAVLADDGGAGAAMESQHTELRAAGKRAAMASQHTERGAKQNAERGGKQNAERGGKQDAEPGAAGLRAAGQRTAGEMAAMASQHTERGKTERRVAMTGVNVPVRPTHIDQYVHLLPKKTQERAAKYGPLMRELDEMREKARLLMDAEGVSSKDREAVAKRIVAIDKEIGGIKKELDAEWEKLVKAGRVVVDDLGMAHILSEECGVKSEECGVKSEESATAELSSEDKARRRSLRKWLVDTRRGNSSEDAVKEHAAKWRENFKEYLTLEGEKAFDDDAIRKGAEHYGVELSRLKD